MTPEPKAPKPPLGLLRKSVAEATWRRYREGEIVEAMLRYGDAGKQIPLEWIIELDALLRADQQAHEETNAT